MMHIQALVSSANCLPMDMHLRDRHTDGLTDSAHLGTESNKKIFKMIQDISGLCFNYSKLFEAGHLHELLHRIF